MLELLEGPHSAHSQVSPTHSDDRFQLDAALGRIDVDVLVGKFLPQHHTESNTCLTY